MSIPSYTIVAEPIAPDAAIAFWQQRAKLTYGEAKALGDGARHRAFYVAGLAQRDLVRLVSDGIEEALKNGETLADFKKRIQKAITAQGWHSHRVENIFRTNMQTAYAAGRYAKMQAVKKSRPYWQYISVEDKRRRPSHAVLHGLVYPADHEFWGVNYPPNGFRCRCTVRTLSKRQVEKEGLSVKRAMPKATMWTDPKTGMEYHVAFPGADKGFRNNVGKDWLAGLDLTQYPDVNEKSYEKQRGAKTQKVTTIKSKVKPNTVKSNDELCAALKKHCSPFATNNGITNIVVSKTSKYFMATDSNGIIGLSNHTSTHSNGFNPARDLRNAWNNIAKGKTLSWNEEYAMESLWHEITHNTQKKGDLGKGDTPERRIMEVFTQWSARRTYPQLIESLGGKARHQKDILKNGLGYGRRIQNFDRLLEVLQIPEKDMLDKIQELTASVSRADYKRELETFLVKQSGKDTLGISLVLDAIADSNFDKVLRTLKFI